MNEPVERLTPAGVGGVAVLAVRGAEAEGRLARLFSRRLPAPGEVAHGFLADALPVGAAQRWEPDLQGADLQGVGLQGVGAGVLDEVLVVRQAEGGLEVHVHGSPAIVREALRLLRADGAPRPPAAEPRRLPAEERARLAVHQAPTILGARILLDQAAGALRAELEALRSVSGAERTRALALLARRGEERRRLFEPATVVLSGPVNVGKSTLFNALVGEDAAVVTDVPGTTRDAHGQRARIGPWPVLLIDTAGWRDLDAAVAAGVAAAQVERAGQRLAAEVAGRADLVLTLVSMDSVKGGAEPTDLGVPRAPAGTVPRVMIGTQAARSHGSETARWGRGVISALEDPRHARGEILSVFERALELSGPAAEAWRAGEAVPFDRDLCVRIAELGRSGEVSVAALDALLADL